MLQTVAQGAGHHVVAVAGASTRPAGDHVVAVACSAASLSATAQSYSANVTAIGVGS